MRFSALYIQMKGKIHIITFSNKKSHIYCYYFSKKKDEHRYRYSSFCLLTLIFKL